MADILIPHPQDFDEKLKHMIAWGKAHLHVVADFDRTLTKAFVNGEKRFSLITVIENKGLLWPEFSTQSKANFDTYYPIEMDPNIILEEKKKAMIARWNAQFKLIIASWISKKIIKNIIDTESIDFRDWYEVFFDLLHKNAIPLVIISATGLWYECISYSLERVKKLFENIYIIANAFVRDDQGNATGVKEPIIHSFNKDETIVHDLPIYVKIKERKNVLLLGDSPGDVHMADGFDYEHILKIWFLNSDTPENRKLFQERFDLIILGDGSMDEVNKVLEKIV